MRSLFIRSALLTLAAGLLSAGSAHASGDLTRLCGSDTKGRSLEQHLDVVLQMDRLAALERFTSRIARLGGSTRQQMPAAAPKATAEPIGWRSQWFMDPNCPFSQDTCEIWIDYDEGPPVRAWTSSYYCPSYVQWYWYNQAAYNACMASYPCYSNGTYSDSCGGP